MDPVRTEPLLLEDGTINPGVLELIGHIRLGKALQSVQFLSPRREILKSERVCNWLTILECLRTLHSEASVKKTFGPLASHFRPSHPVLVFETMMDIPLDTRAAELAVYLEHDQPYLCWNEDLICR